MHKIAQHDCITYLPTCLVTNVQKYVHTYAKYCNTCIIVVHKCQQVYAYLCTHLQNMQHLFCPFVHKGSGWGIVQGGGGGYQPHGKSFSLRSSPHVPRLSATCVWLKASAQEKQSSGQHSAAPCSQHGACRRRHRALPSEGRCPQTRPRWAWTFATGWWLPEKCAAA